MDLRLSTEYAIALGDIADSDGRRCLSYESRRLLALLIAMPELIKSPHDRSSQYTDASPATLLGQLNECWNQVRIFKTAVQDRDRIIDSLNQSVAHRDELIKKLNRRLQYARLRIALMYSIVGGAAAKGAEVIAVAALAWLHHAR